MRPKSTSKIGKPVPGVEPKSRADLEEVHGVFSPRRDESERDYDADGWRDPGRTMLRIVEEMVETLETGKPLNLTTAEDLAHSFEIAVALRESARKGSVPVTLPLADRSITMYPERSRWFYKKTLMGDEAYMKQLAGQKKD